jgi:hypothetical protein
MDQRPRTTPVAAPAGGPRRASILASSIVVALALAVLKPWSLVQTGPGTGASGSAVPLWATPTGSPGSASTSPSAPPGDPNAMACLADETEQVLTVERSADREVRSWIAAPELAATGPLDPRLVPLTVFSSHVVGIGVCAARTAAGVSPTPGAGGPGAGSGATILDVESITIVSGVAVAADLGPPQLLAGALNSTDPAPLYGPPPTGVPAATSSHAGAPSAHASVTTRATDVQDSASPTPGEAAWRAGSYAIAFRFPFDAGTVVRWLRIDLVTGVGGGARLIPGNDQNAT